MSSGGKGSKPKSPNYERLAYTQAALDNPDTVFGSTDYTKNPDGTVSAVQNLSPEQLALYNRDVSQAGNWQAEQDRALQAYNQMRGQGGDARQQVQDALYRRATTQLDPQFAQSEEAMRTRLSNQGIYSGSEQYGQQFDNFERQKQAAYGDARDRAILAGGQEESRINSDADQYLDLINSMYDYQYPLAAGTSPDIAGSARQKYQDKVGMYNANAAQQQSYLNALTSLGSAGILAMSDRRFKRDIQRVAGTVRGLPVYLFRYLGSLAVHLGFMADEVAAVRPDCVVVRDGVMFVNFKRLLGGLR